MGLDVSHDCYHGGYSTFMCFRNEIAKVVGIPLELMEGFCSVDYHCAFSYVEKVLEEYAYAEANPNEPLRYNFRELYLAQFIHDKVIAYLPIKWGLLKKDPIIHLLNHSDCDGYLNVNCLIPLAERLEEIAPSLPTEPRDYKQKALTFAEGLRLAHSKKERVEFH